MPLICYTPKKFKGSSQEIIDKANAIIEEYEEQGFDLTLRQLYYQFVSRDLIPNNMKSYKRLGSVINDARLAGLIDWHAIVDRTRELKKLPDWSDAADILQACAKQFRFDKWRTQRYRPEVWIEKDALTGVIQGVCHELQVPYFSCRGYTSQSEMWSAAQRLITYAEGDQTPYILHLGDHDPSGIDMSRDIQDRLRLFAEHHDVTVVHFNRLALNMDQVEEYDPPPNPAKITDSRSDGYIAEYGHESWELDALEPAVMVGLIRKTIMSIRNEEAWVKELKKENNTKQALRFAADNWRRIEAISEDDDWYADPDEDPDDAEEGSE